MRYFPEYSALVDFKVMIGTVIAYFIAVFLLKKWMDNDRREKYKLESFMIIYNAAQVALCLYMGIGLMRANFTFDNPFGLNTQPKPEIEWFIFVHYLSKYLDLADTFIMILKKNFRQLSFLHLYHHGSILLIWGFLCNIGQANGTVYFGANINSWIHVIMYSHYLMGALKIENPFRRWITVAQIGQMYICFFHAILAVFFEKIVDANLGMLQAAYHISMIILFTNFYIQDKKAKRAARKAEEEQKNKGVESVKNK